MEWVWSFLFGLWLIYAIANTNSNKKNTFSIQIFFPSDSLIKKNTHTHTHKLNIIIKTQNQNLHKRVQKSRIYKNK